MKSFKDVEKNIDIFMDGRYKAIDSIKFVGDIYLFGIWSGCSTKNILDYIPNNKYQLAYGFDSFEGLPEETTGVQKYHNFNAGSYSSLDLYGGENSCKVSTEILKGIGKEKLTFFNGFYKDVLTKELARNMIPASYVDIDCDLYCSTDDILTWMLTNKLICKSTIVYFDDWGSTAEYAGGESLAWKEAVEKYGIKYEEIYSHRIGESVVKAMEVLCVSG